jgi:hypothetical protein
MRISRTALPHLLHVEAYETYPAGATFGSAYSIVPSRSPIAPGQTYVDPETPGRFSLRLDVYPPPQVLQIVGRLYHLVLAFPYVGDIANGRAPSLHGHYSASSLLRARPTPSRLWPTSRFRRLYGLPCSGDFSLGRGGSLQLLGMSLSPCCRFHPAKVEMPHRSDFGTPCCLRPTEAGSALGSSPFEATFTFTVVTARQLVVSPRETLSIGFRILISLHPAIQTTGLLTFAPAGLPPAEHTSLNWTHFRTAGFPQYGWKAGISDGAFLTSTRA